MPVTAGDFWDITDPAKPIGEFDPNAKLRFPLTVQDILDGMGTTYASHEIIAALPVEVLDPGTHAAGVVTPFIGLLDGSTWSLGDKLAVTIRIVGADGQQDDRTVYLKLKER